MKTTLTLSFVLAVSALCAPVFASEPEDFLKKEKCVRCHTATTTKKGPAFTAVAAKYKGQAGAADTVVTMLKNGNDDHKPLKAGDVELKAVAEFILSRE